MQDFSQAGKKQILVADDDDSLRELMCEALSRNGYHAIPAQDGAEALHMLETHKFDGVLLDLVMPGMDGFEVLAEKAKSSSIAAVPVAVLSSRNRMVDVEKAMALGAAAYVIKPFKPEVFMVRLNRALPDVFALSLAQSRPRFSQPSPSSVEFI
jgi:CheY-like chemotaxis protein